MQHLRPMPSDPITFLCAHAPDVPILFLAPAVLDATAQAFLRAFPGLVTYAVKANAERSVIATLAAAGVTAFDVASPAEMAAVRGVAPGAVLHYNNPVRSAAEIDAGIAAGVASWSVDASSELAKLRDVPRECEIAVRFALPVAGAAYDFGEKFGATPQAAAALLQEVAAAGFIPALTFHPGTQCTDPAAWQAYIAAAAQISRAAGVRVARLNVGGGFPTDRGAGVPDIAAICRVIAAAVDGSFGADAPALVCEPGRAMVAPCATLAARIKAVRGDLVYLNDGIYGGLMELRDLGVTGLMQVIGPDGALRGDAVRPRVVYGPTCDSLDRLPGCVDMPGDCDVGDFVLFGGMGAYSVALNTGFNGYGIASVQTVAALQPITGQAALRR